MSRPIVCRAYASRIAGLVLSVGIITWCGGCALIPLATLSTVVGMAGDVAPVAPAVFHAGKLDVTMMTKYDEVLPAVRQAAWDLQMHVVRDQKNGGGDWDWDFQLRDDKKEKVEITVRKCTATMCKCQVDVGLFGSEPTARLIMWRIEMHLPGEVTPGEFAADQIEFRGNSQGCRREFGGHGPV